MLATTKIFFNQDVFFLLLLLSFFLIALVKGLYWKHAKLLFMGAFSRRYANQYLKESNAFTERLNLITFFLMIINITLLIVKAKEIFDLWKIFYVFCFVVLFYVIKIIVIKSLGHLFKLNDISVLAVFFSLLYDKTFGFLLFPLLVLFCFFLFNVSYYLTLSLLLLFVFILIFKLFCFWKIGIKSFGFSPFYIFLYLCFFEIFPILLVFKIY